MLYALATIQILATKNAPEHELSQISIILLLIYDG